MPIAIHRYEVPVDDSWHSLPLSGAVVHVAARQAESVEVWAFSDGSTAMTRTFRAFGTGQPLPKGDPLSHCGTALAPGGLVWHLMERHH